MSIDRQAMIEEYIAACTECGGRDFPKCSDCEGCIAAVDEQIAVKTSADLYTAATHAIATGA
jgi:uncharacterized OB-fold protein